MSDGHKTTPPPDWLKPDRPDSNFHSGPDDGRNGPLVIFPCSHDGMAVLDGAFTPAELRAVADWVEANSGKR